MTYWDGPPPFKGKLPSDAHLAYEGPEGYLLCHILEGRLYIHAGLLGPRKRATFERQREILDDFEVQLMDRGIKRYYTAVKTPRQAKYAEWLGFDFTGESFLDTLGRVTPFEIMSKDLV